MKSMLPTNPGHREKINTQGFEEVPELMKKIMDQAISKKLSREATVELVHSTAKEWRK